MKDRLAEVVDEVVITGQNTGEKMCSCESDVVDETCSSESYDACRDRHMSTQGEFIEILSFRHFARYMQFSKTDPRGVKKEISTSIHVSVVMELV